jgi:hypothetical protein
MKHIISKIWALLLVLLIAATVAVPAFAADKGCNHAINNDEYSALVQCDCINCNEKVYVCDTCGEILNVEVRICPVCETKRAAITPEEKQEDYLESLETAKQTAVVDIIFSIMILALGIYFIVLAVSTRYFGGGCLALVIITLGVCLLITGIRGYINPALLL